MANDSCIQKMFIFYYVPGIVQRQDSISFIVQILTFLLRVVF